MARWLSATLATVCTLLLFSTLVSCKAKRHLKSDAVDSLKSLENFPYAIALYDIDRDGDLDGLNALRTDFESESPNATYILSLQDTQGGILRNHTYRLLPGLTPDRQVGIIDNDYDHQIRNHYIYSDYESCILMKFPMESHEPCVLWVTSAVKDDVPQSCVDQFQDNCKRAPIYDKQSYGDLIH